MKSYREQQRERLSEAVFDYLSDENITAEELISDFYAEIKSSFDYFDKYAKKCEKVLETLDVKKSYEKDPDTKYSEHYYDIDRNGKSSFNESRESKDWEDFWSSITAVDTIYTTDTKNGAR